MSCHHVAQTDQNGNMVLDCNDTQYINNMIEALKKATLDGNKSMIKVYANQLESFKQLCGSHPVLEVFERQLCYTANKLGLAQCSHVQRALQPTPQQKAEAKKRYTMLGLQTMEINKDRSLSVVEPSPPRKRTPIIRSIKAKTVLKPKWNEL